MTYSWLTFLQARQQLAARLADPTNQFWTDAENGAYIVEALRTHNALTFTWKTSFVFTLAAAFFPQWLSLGTLATSPRLRSVTDTVLYTLMQYHLLEPPSGGTWTGTSQFTIADFQQALQRCRDEAIQFANTNQQNPPSIPTTPGDTFINLPDNFLDVPRARFVEPAPSAVPDPPSDDPLPADAVITGIYPVFVGSSNVDNAVHRFYVNNFGIDFLYPFDPQSASFTDMLFYGNSIGTDLSLLDASTVSSDIDASLFLDGLTDTTTITAVGYAIVYTSATPVINTQIAAPFTIPAGHGLQWALPFAVLTTNGNPGLGSISATAAHGNDPVINAAGSFALSAGRPLGNTIVLATWSGFVAQPFVPPPPPPPPPGDNIGVTLMRTDTTALNFYQTNYPQTPPDLPKQYNIASLPPLQLQVDIAPAVEGGYDLIVLIAPPPLSPPTASLLFVPDDCVYALKWGALADLLSRESEATDLVRAKYAKQRYGDLLKVMSAQPWIMQGFINGQTANMVDMTTMDWRRPEWDSNPPDFQTIITAGIDFFTVVPDPDNAMVVGMTVLGNAPVPNSDGSFIQCSRDVWDAILDYAQFLAAYKQGGQEFLAAMPLEANFYSQAMKINGRLEKLGLFANVYDAEGMREIRVQERFDQED